MIKSLLSALVFVFVMSINNPAMAVSFNETPDFLPKGFTALVKKMLAPFETNGEIQVSIRAVPTSKKSPIYPQWLTRVSIKSKGVTYQGFSPHNCARSHTEKCEGHIEDYVDLSRSIYDAMVAMCVAENNWRNPPTVLSYGANPQPKTVSLINEEWLLYRLFTPAVDKIPSIVVHRLDNGVRYSAVIPGYTLADLCHCHDTACHDTMSGAIQCSVNGWLNLKNGWASSYYHMKPPPTVAEWKEKHGKEQAREVVATSPEPDSGVKL